MLFDGYTILSAVSVYALTGSVTHHEFTIAVEKVLLSVVPLLVSYSAVFFFDQQNFTSNLGCLTEISFWTLLVQ
jgi:hypothetical protein